MLLYKGYPIIINKNKSNVINLQHIADSNFNPIENFDFSTGTHKAYLLFSKKDIAELPKEMNHGKIFECKENNTLKDLQKVFFFYKLKGDMATCDSEIFIYNDNKLIFHSDFVFTDSIIGIQNSVVGWAEPVHNAELKKILLKFKEVTVPIVIL